MLPFLQDEKIQAGLTETLGEHLELGILCQRAEAWTRNIEIANRSAHSPPHVRTDAASEIP
jgi:hypothetical protein